MLKYDEIIKGMSDSEKIRLLCDVRSLSERRVKGLSAWRMDSAESLGKGVFPSPFALANSWDVPLVGQVAQSIANKAIEADTDLLTVPAPRVRISPWRTALSEDPLLAEELSRAYLAAADSVGISACVGSFGLHADEAELLDREPNERFLQEFLIKPYAQTLSGESCAALISLRELDGAYGGVNGSLVREARRSGAIGDTASVCGRVSAEDTVPSIVNGRLFLEGSSVAVESALSRYRTLERAVRQEEESEQTLADELAQGKALSPEQLDLAVDQMLDFIFSAKRAHVPSETSEQDALAACAVRRSAVLLKNNGDILPLRAKRRIALIGDAVFAISANGERAVDALERLLSARGYEVVGKEKGYEWNKTRNEDMIAPALALAEQADAVLLFLGNGETRAKKMRLTKRLTLPANQMALLDSLGACREKTVAILPSDELWDMELTEHCAAILTLPMYTGETYGALADILTGEMNPCGKLSNTVYVRSDGLYADLMKRKKRDGLKTGVFLAYRNYVTSGENVGFAFGHGLSYTKFNYREMKAEDGAVSVTVTNVGTQTGEEVVQLYAKKADSAVMRPERVLVGFARICLRPEETGTVRIPFKLPEVYSSAAGGYVTETGDYELLAGASSADIRLSCRVGTEGASLACDGETLSDYIHTRSNIITDHYKLEAKGRKMKRSVFNWIAGGAAIVMAIALKLYCISAETETPFFSWFALILCALGLSLFVAEAVYRSRLRKSEQAMLDRENETLFESAEQISEYDAEEMFSEAFDVGEKAAPEENTERAEGSRGDHSANIERERTFEAVSREFELFAKERGCKLRADTAKKLFAALAGSRLIVFSGLEQQSFRKLMHLLSDYLKTEFCIDGTDGFYVRGENVLYGTDGQGNQVETNVLRAIGFARSSPDGIQLAGLSEVRSEALQAYFTPFMQYIKHPLGNAPVRIVNDMNVESTHRIPQNLWFVLNLAEGETPDRICPEISCEAVVDTPLLDICPESDRYTRTKGLGYGQLEYLGERLASVQAPEESLWRRVDRLEDASRRVASFEIGNKHWLSLETFACAYIACGGGADEAVDAAAAARLIAPMLSVWRTAGGDGHEFSELVASAFGDEQGEACDRLVRLCIENRI